MNRSAIRQINSKPSITFIDNFDSFSWNLVDQFRCLGYPVTVYRNDVPLPALIDNITKQKGLLVLSPGPGAPSSAGNMMSLIKALAGKVPILGICLGHQAIIQHYGGIIGQAPEIVHGKSSAIEHTGEGVFRHLPNPLRVGRYHSLAGFELPSCLTVTAHVNGIAMAIQHCDHPVIGFQFHPESILTEHGAILLEQTLTFLTTETHV